MRLTEDEARSRLASHDHGVFSTLHPERGVDSVPVVYAVVDGHVGVPVDRVKPKSSSLLQRERNLELDPRATLLIEHWDRDDWAQLWWVRAELSHDPAASPERQAALADQLAQRFPQYHDRPFERMLVLRVLALSGWAASGAVDEV